MVAFLCSSSACSSTERRYTGHRVLERCNDDKPERPEPPMPPPSTFTVGLTRFSVFVSLRWEDKSKPILLPPHKALCVSHGSRGLLPAPVSDLGRPPAQQPGHQSGRVAVRLHRLDAPDLLPDTCALPNIVQHPRLRPFAVSPPPGAVIPIAADAGAPPPQAYCGHHDLQRAERGVLVPQRLSVAAALLQLSLVF